MQIVIRDTSCLIDLRKGDLITGLLALPYRFAVPLPLFEDELLDMSEREKTLLVESGLEVWDLSEEQVKRAGGIHWQNKALTINDCFAFVIAADVQDSILPTSDGPLRQFASRHAIKVHGVLWAIDELHESSTLPSQVLYRALVIFEDDPLSGCQQLSIHADFESSRDLANRSRHPPRSSAPSHPSRLGSILKGGAGTTSSQFRWFRAPLNHRRPPPTTLHLVSHSRHILKAEMPGGGQRTNRK